MSFRVGYRWNFADLVATSFIKSHIPAQLIAPDLDAQLTEVPEVGAHHPRASPPTLPTARVPAHLARAFLLAPLRPAGAGGAPNAW